MGNEQSNKTFKIAKVKDEFSIVINGGSEDGIQAGQRFLIYSIGEEIFDPDTKKSLGQLEIVKGTGRATHIQKNIATIKSDMKTQASRTIRKTRPGGSFGAVAALMGATETEEHLQPETMPFEEPMEGDIAKLI